MKKAITIFLTIFLSVTLFTPTVFAQQVSTVIKEVEIPPFLPPDERAVSTPTFDPQLGTLLGADYGIWTSIQGQLCGENTSPAHFLVSVVVGLPYIISLSGVGEIANDELTTSHTFDLSSFDNTLDYAGPSGACYPFLVTKGVIWTPIPSSALRNVALGIANFNMAADFGTCDASGPPNVSEFCQTSPFATFFIRYRFAPN